MGGRTGPVVACGLWGPRPLTMWMLIGHGSRIGDTADGTNATAGVAFVGVGFDGGGRGNSGRRSVGAAVAGLVFSIFRDLAETRAVERRGRGVDRGGGMQEAGGRESVVSQVGGGGQGENGVVRELVDDRLELDGQAC